MYMLSNKTNLMYAHQHMQPTHYLISIFINLIIAPDILYIDTSCILQAAVWLLDTVHMYTLLACCTTIMGGGLSVSYNMHVLSQEASLCSSYNPA